MVKKTSSTPTLKEKTAWLNHFLVPLGFMAQEEWAIFPHDKHFLGWRIHRRGYIGKLASLESDLLNDLTTVLTIHREDFKKASLKWPKASNKKIVSNLVAEIKNNFDIEMCVYDAIGNRLF